MEEDIPLVWDIETSPLRVAYETYSLKNYSRYIDPKHIERDWIMLGAAWKPLGGQARCISVSPQDPMNDEYVVRRMHEVLSGYNTLIGHNIKAFDVKKFNTRAIYYNLPPLQNFTQIDTLTMARSFFKFTSNKLAYLAKFLGIEAKENSPDWAACMAGDTDALAYMRKYNKKDVIVNEGVYLKLRGYAHTHPKLPYENRDIEGKKIEGTCHTCGSATSIKNGTRKKMWRGELRRFQRWICQNPTCGKQFQDTKPL